jgi:3-hydroxyisobutyrate dehydrogenase
MKIGFIGVGAMGQPMLANLVKHGHQVVAYDVIEAALAGAVKAGATRAASSAAAARDSELVITILPSSSHVEAAYLGQGGVLEGVGAGRLCIDMSTIDPSVSRRVADAVSKRGARFIDAPVSGGVPRATDGTLAIMVGGDAATIDRIAALLGAMGTSIFRTGALGSGHAMKALNNYVSSAGLIAAVEALLIGRKFGLDPALMADILNASSGKNNTTEGKLKQFIISETFADGFPLRLMAKDVRTADDMAHALGIATPLADLCAQLWAAAAQALDETANHTQVLRYMEKLGG